MPTFLFMDDSANELLCFLVWPFQRQQWVLLCNCLVGALPYSHYVIRSLPLCGVRVLHPAPCDLLYSYPGDRQKQTKTATWLPSSRCDWHVLQRPCHVTARGGGVGLGGVGREGGRVISECSLEEKCRYPTTLWMPKGFHSS